MPLALAQQLGVGYAAPGTWPHAARDWRGARWTGSARYWRRPRAGGSTALSLAAVVAQLAAMEAGELLARTRHRRPRLVPGEEPPAAAVAERIVRMSAAELQDLVQRLRARLAPEPVQA